MDQATNRHVKLQGVPCLGNGPWRFLRYIASTLGKRESSQSTVHRMVAGDTLYRSHTVGKAKKKRPRQVKAPYSTNHQLETAPNTSCIQVFKLWVKMQTRCRFIPYTGRPTMMQRILSTAMNDRRVERVVVR